MSGMSQNASIRMPFSWRNPMDDLHHECAVQRPRERPYGGETEGRGAVGGVPRVPDQENVVPDLGNPMESQVEVRPLRVVVVLHEAKKTGPRIEVVLDAAGGQQGREAAGGQPRRRAGQVGADNNVPAAAPRALHLHVRTAAAVKRAQFRNTPKPRGRPGAMKYCSS